MGTLLQQTLRSLCFNTEWKYAVYWKLKRRARMMLIWEDAYYDKPEQSNPSEYMCFRDAHVKINDGLQDPLGLALAKMSYLVYSLGEGIIGQVALTGRHQWIFSDTHTSSSWSSSEYCDGWKTQFAAGIKTIAVVAVVPHGVVQLGSLNTVIEDLKAGNPCKGCILFTSKFLYGISGQSNAKYEDGHLMSEISAKCLDRVDKAVKKRSHDFHSHLLPSIGKHLNDVVALPGPHGKEAVEMLDEHIGVKSPTFIGDESTQFLYPRSRICSLDNQKEVDMKMFKNKKYREEINRWKDCVGSIQNDASVSQDLLNTTINITKPLPKPEGGRPFLPPDLLEPAVDMVKCFGVHLQNKELHIPEPLEVQRGKGSEDNMKFRTEINCTNTVDNSLKFSTVCELHEALGPAFRREQQCFPWNEAEGAGSGIPIELQEGMDYNQFMLESGSEHLLDAVVANACQGTNNVKSDTFCKSVESLITTKKIKELPSHIKHPCTAGGLPESSVEEDSHCSLASTWGSTESRVVRSQKELSLTTLSAHSEQLERQVEPPKINRKRTRPGETCRPRPRDRQLIQDRVKELRELVPNGSKCSIDALLELTIKHLLFLQSVTKHADKLRRCAESKTMDLLGSCSHDHGSSWALEVGSQTNSCPVIVENLNMNGQMLIEILCEDCNHFLEIAEAIRRLGLTILKGLTEAHGKKTWACFIVEEQNNKGMHRMDILWSLMQFLQPKATV
uniref:BHLH domain-containing protein n=1 Tax=Nelumbo nucifera TaxID=4432 RepID=A0A822XM52_NELNU|nr:TPA_asm: hypothetical protein HUJ06_021318 [Nelumbo nucifera]